MCESYCRQYGVDFRSAMPTNLYGPGDNYHPKNSHVLPGLIRRFCEAKEKKQRQVVCWGTGSPYREFLHVDDLGQACVFALEKWDLDVENAPKDSSGLPLPFLNVGTGSDISIKQLASLIAKYVDYDGEIIWDTTKPDGTPKKQLDVRRINSIGWQSKINIEEGLRDTIKIYKEKNFKILTY